MRRKLGAIVAAYIRDLRQLARSELDWFATQPNLTTAVSLAARAVGRSGKRLSHQNRIPPAAIREAHERLVSAVARLRKLEDFDDLHRLVDELVRPTRGIGELYVYDAALRIGAALKLSPTEVYIHSGVRVGATRLGFSGSRTTIAMAELPAAFQRLAPHEVEDVLCIYKDALGDVGPATSRGCGPRALVRPIC